MCVRPWDYLKQAPAAVEQARSISRLDRVKGDLNQALVSLGIVLLMFVVFINCCLGFFCVCQLVIVIFVVLVAVT